MSYHRRVKGRGLPAWLVFLMAIALVFGGYYMWIGARDFLRTGGLGIEEATAQAEIVGSATARREATRPSGGGGDVFGVTQQPTITPIPPCEEFVVTAATGILRSDPTVRGNILNTLDEGTTICVVGTEPVGEWVWYKIDTNPLTRRLDLGYMREDVIAPLNPTLTPSQTFTTAPTVTEMPTLLPSLTYTRTPTPTRDPRDTDTPEPTLTPTPTPPLQNV